MTSAGRRPGAARRRAAAALLVLMVLLAAPQGTSAQGSAGGLGSLPSRPSPDAAAAHDTAPGHPADPVRLAGPLLQGLERAGSVPRGLAAAMSASASVHPGEEGMHWRWSRIAGDLDGDGVDDLVRNDIDLVTGAVDVHAVSGADGTSIWEFDNGIAVSLMPRGGQPIVRDHGRATGAGDVDGDGVPDVAILAIDGTVALDVHAAATATYPYALHAVDGSTGTPLWSHEGTAQVAVVRVDPFVMVIDDLPTGWLVEPAHHRMVLKTTDVRFAQLYDPTCLVGCLVGWYIQDTQVSDTVTALALDGTVAWSRDLPASEDPEHTRWRWLAGTVDRGGTVDVVLDALLLSRPQYSERLLFDPIYGEPAANYGRGMLVRSLDGATGTDRWSTTVFDEAALRANPPLHEEPYPVLAWTHGYVMTDLDGDGVADPMASYLVQEASDPTSSSGRYRTHFVPLSGTDGEVLMRHRVQGWGFASPLGVPGRFAVGTVDIPTGVEPGGAFPEKNARLGVVDVTDGPVWNHEAPYGQASALTYELSLTQLHGGLTIADADGDGVRDLLSPARYEAPEGRNQTLTANARHHYDVLSGASGDVIHTVTAWGRTGFAVPCAADGLVFLTGHGRRVDATRVDLEDGVLWRHTLLWDDRPRPATAPVNIILWGGACDHADGLTALSNNMVTSFVGNTGWPETEVPSQIAGVRPDTVWVDPTAPRDTPAGSVLFAVRAAPGEPLLTWTNLAFLGASILGGAGGGGLWTWLRVRRPDDGLGKDPLGLGRTWR